MICLTATHNANDDLSCKVKTKGSNLFIDSWILLNLLVGYNINNYDQMTMDSAVKTGYNIDDQYGTYFMTFTFVGWIDLLSRKELRDLMVESLSYCQDHKGLVINAYVLMSSHMHMICRANEDSDGLSRIIQDFKKYTAKEIIKWIENDKRESRADWLKVVMKYHAKHQKNKSTYQVWQRSNQPKSCLHPRFTLQKINYIHNNPVVAGYVDEPYEYVYSSARDYVGRHGLINVEIVDFGVQEGYVLT